MLVYYTWVNVATDCCLCVSASLTLVLSRCRLSCLFSLACCLSISRAERAESKRTRSYCSSSCFFSSSTLYRCTDRQTVNSFLNDQKERVFLSIICSCFTFFSSIWYFWNWMICCRLSGGALLSLLGQRPGTPTMPRVGSASAPVSCPRLPSSLRSPSWRRFSSIFAHPNPGKRWVW